MISGKFQADFSSFIEAVDRSVIKLADFGKGASGVESRLNSMVDSFSGRKIIQEASLMTIAVEKAGGVATLTAKQLETIGAKAAEAADKLTKLGYDVPAGLQKLADETKTANTHFSTMKDLAGSLAGAFGVAFSLGAVVSFGKELFAAADNLVKLHDKTGVSVEGLQRFQVAGDDAGNTVDQITSAIAKMENKLVGGDSSATAALEKMGLSFEDIQKLTPENQFIAISEAIRKVDDPAQQVNIAMGLFGKAGAEILPTLKRGFDDLKDSAGGMSKETVKAFDDAGDALARWWRSTKGYTSEAVVAFVHMAEDGFNPANHALAEMERQGQATAGVIADMTAQAARFTPKLQALGPDVIDADAALQLLRDQMRGIYDAENLAAEAAKKHAAELAKFEEVMKDLETAGDGWRGTLDTIDGSVVEGVKGYLAAEVSASSLAKAYGLTATQLKAVETSLKEESAMHQLQRSIEKTAIAESLKEYDTWAKGVSKAADDVGQRIIAGAVEIGAAQKSVADLTAQAGLSSYDYQITKINEWATSAKGAFKGTGEQAAAFYSLVDAESKLRIDALGSDWKVLRDSSIVSMQDTADKAAATYDYMAAHADEFSAATIEKFRTIAQAAQDAADGTQHAWVKSFEAIGAQLPKLIQQAFTGGGGLSGAANAVGSLAGSEVGKGLVTHMTEQAPAFMGSALGKMFGSAIPVVGALAGPLLGKLVDVFSGGAEHIINPIREAFVQSFGGLDALNKKAADAGVTLNNLLNAKNQDQYKTAVDALNKAFADQKTKIDADSSALGELVKSGQTLGIALPKALQDSIQKLVDLGKITGDTATLFAGLAGQTGVDFQKMSTVAGKYGIDLADLGPAFQSAKLHDAASGIINDFDLLSQGGANTDKVLAGMKGPINDLVNQSIKFGVDIPQNMQPWIAQLEKTGQLTDENGVKITDLSGLKFSPPIVTEFQKIVDKLQQLIDKITGPNGVVAGINAIPDKKTTEIVTVHTDIFNERGADDSSSYAAGGGIVRSFGVQYLAGGGRVLPFTPRGSDVVPAMLAVGEGVVSERGMRSIGASGLAAINSGQAQSGGGTDVSALQAELVGLRQDMADMMRLLPKLVVHAAQVAPRKVA